MRIIRRVLFIFNFELMRQFFLALGRFGLVLLVVCVAVCLVYQEALRRSFEGFVADFNSRDIRVLVIGDSHPQCSISVDDWDEAFSFAVGGEWLPYNYIRLEMVAEHCSDVNVVILGLSYHSFAYAHDFLPDDTYRFCFNLYPFIEDGHIPWGHPAYRTWLEAKLNHDLGIVTKNAIPDIKKAVLDHFPFVDTILLTPDERSIMAPVPIDWEASNKSHYFSPELKPPSSLSMTALHQIRDFCLQKGYKLILYNAPVPKSYFEHIPPVYKHLTDSVAHAMTDNQNVYYLDYSQYPLPDSCFMDGNHTNIYGARIVTSLLRDSLAALGIIHTAAENNKSPQTELPYFLIHNKDE